MARSTCVFSRLPKRGCLRTKFCGSRDERTYPGRNRTDLALQADFISSDAIMPGLDTLLQQDVGTKAEVGIDSGNVPEVMNRAAEQTKADVLVIGHIPSGGHLGANGSGYLRLSMHVRFRRRWPRLAVSRLEQPCLSWPLPWPRRRV